MLKPKLMEEVAELEEQRARPMHENEEHEYGHDDSPLLCNMMCPLPQQMGPTRM